MKNRQAATITSAWKKISEKIATAAAKPITCVIDNEASADLKAALLKDGISHQLVPPHAHRTNLAKRAIQTF